MWSKIKNLPGLVITAILFASILSCGTTKISVKLKPPREIKPSGKFLAGAAKVDITPPPGYPMGGYAIAGKFARGWWTRLYARAIYLEDRRGNRLALVSCDLWAMPAGLADRVSEIIAGRGDSTLVARQQLIIAATHTHNSPGNYSSAEVYNLLASPGSGFDSDLFEFLAHRIAASVNSAIKSKEPATIEQDTLRLSGISRNRSIEAFEKNPETEKDEIEQSVSPNAAAGFFNEPLPPGVTTPEVFRAVNPTLTVLKIEGQNEDRDEPIAVVAFYAMHPTAMGPTTEVYCSDVFGVASSLAEQHLKGSTEEANCVVAIFNGAEGDISPNWFQQDRRNTLRLGRQLARGILISSARANRVLEPVIKYRYSQIKIKDRLVFNLHADTDMCISGDQMKTGKKAFPGVAVLGGADDGRTFFYNFGFREGLVSDECDDRHGLKVFSVDKLLKQFLKLSDKNLIRKATSKVFKNVLAKSFPEKVSVGVYSIGKTTLVTLPGEFTVALGHRIKKSLIDPSEPDKQIVLIGLANEYLSYFTTPLEYNAQHYEGASTMYGQAAGTFIEQELQNTAKMTANTARYDFKKTYKAGPRGKNLGKIEKNDGWQFSEALTNILQDTATGQFFRGFPQITWTDDSRTLTMAKPGIMQTTNPTVWIEEKSGGSWRLLNERFNRLDKQGQILIPESDTSSLNFVTVVESVTKDSVKWHSIWLAQNTSQQAMYRFCVKKTDGKTIYEPVRNNP